MTSTFFGHVKRKRPPALVYKFLRDLESGLFETPRSFDVLARYRTEELKLNKSGSALRVSYPENPLILAFCKKYPQVRLPARLQHHRWQGPPSDRAHMEAPPHTPPCIGLRMVVWGGHTGHSRSHAA